MENIVDKYLDEIVSIGLNSTPGAIANQMEDKNQPKDEEWRRWFPIPSTVTDVEIEEFESQIGHQLPDSYKRFLKHKHFYYLQIGECSFCEHPYGTWRASLKEMIFDGYPREFLIDTGRIPFANWSDWGLLCFDTTIQHQQNNYQIVLWDHEIFNKFEPRYRDFESMIKELDKEQLENAM